MIQGVLVILLAGFIVGLIGSGLHGLLEGIIFRMLTGSISLIEYGGSWRVLVGMLLLLVIPLGGLFSALMIYYSDNPEKRLMLFDRGKRFLVSLVLIGISFMLYSLMVRFTYSFSEAAIWLVSSTENGFRETVFYDPLVQRESFDYTVLLQGNMQNEMVLDLFKTGTYTVSLLFLAGTLGFQRLLTRFGVILVPLAFFIYSLPFQFLTGWSFNILKGIVLILFLPFVNILLLMVAGVSTGTGHIGQITHILSFLAVGLFNWSVIKKVLLDAFDSNRDPTPFKYIARRYFREQKENEEEGGENRV